MPKFAGTNISGNKVRYKLACQLIKTDLKRRRHLHEVNVCLRMFVWEVGNVLGREGEGWGNVFSRQSGEADITPLPD